MKRIILILVGINAMPMATNAKTIEGFSQPYETVILAAPEAGIIKSLHVKQGAIVSAGQSIAVLDNAVLLASLKAARAKSESKGPVLAAEVANRQRTSRLYQIRKLRENGHASPEEVERAEADAGIANANLVTAREESRANKLAVKQIEAQLERRTIRSPLEGVISYVAKRPGEFVAATDAAVVTIVQIDRLRVVFQIPTEQIVRLNVDDVVRIRFASSTQIADATIDFISPITDAQSNLVRVEVVIANEHGMHRSGVRCELLDFHRPDRPARQQATSQGTVKPSIAQSSQHRTPSFSTPINRRWTRNQLAGEQHVTR